MAGATPPHHHHAVGAGLAITFATQPDNPNQNPPRFIAMNGFYI